MKITRKSEFVIGIAKDIVKGVGNNQKPYMKFLLLGLEDSMTFNLRDKNFDEYEKYIEDGKAIMLKIKWDSFKPKNETKMIEFMKVESVIPEPQFYNQVNKFALSISLAEMIQETLAKLEYVLKNHPGNTPVLLSLETPISGVHVGTSIAEDSPDMPDEEKETNISLQAIEFRSLTYKVRVGERLLNDLYSVISIDKVKLAL